MPYRVSKSRRKHYEGGFPFQDGFLLFDSNFMDANGSFVLDFFLHKKAAKKSVLRIRIRDPVPF
jgi:hypothetical protein